MTVMWILIFAILCVCILKLNPNHFLSYFLLVRIWSKSASKSGCSCYFLLSLSGNREAVQNMLHSNYSWKLKSFRLKIYERFLSLELIQKLAVSAKRKYNKSTTVCLSAMQNDNEMFSTRYMPRLVLVKPINSDLDIFMMWCWPCALSKYCFTAAYHMTLKLY